MHSQDEARVGDGDPKGQSDDEQKQTHPDPGNDWFRELMGALTHVVIVKPNGHREATRSDGVTTRVTELCAAAIKILYWCVDPEGTRFVVQSLRRVGHE